VEEGSAQAPEKGQRLWRRGLKTEGLGGHPVQIPAGAFLINSSAEHQRRENQGGEADIEHISIQRNDRRVWETPPPEGRCNLRRLDVKKTTLRDKTQKSRTVYGGPSESNSARMPGSAAGIRLNGLDVLNPPTTG